MTEDRLTRQELGWLLMQEAKGTARALRDEVSQLKTGQDRLSDQPPPVDSMLDALDGAIEMMSALEVPASSAAGHGKDHRGRIDIAALLFDIAPNAKISIEPGAGTEVFGAANELRRVLDLLLKQSGSDSNASSAIEVRRENDWVTVSIGIGPEGMSTRDLEQRWLNRMATRHGGRVEITGNVRRLYLPADASSGQQEILQLRKELEQAQQLGEVYARELAEAFAVASSDVPPSVAPESRRAVDFSPNTLVAVCNATLKVLRSTTEALRQDAARIARVLGDQHELTTALAARLVAYGELMSDLERIGRVALDEPPRLVELLPLLREVVDGMDGRAHRHDVSLTLTCDAGLRLSTRPQITALVVRALVDQAILSSPGSGSVELVAEFASPVDGLGHVVIRVTDGGPVVPPGTHQALLHGQADPSAIGRRGALSWIVVGVSTSAVGIAVEVGESTDHRSEVRLIFN